MKFIQTDTRILAVFGKVMIDAITLKDVVTGKHRGMRSEHGRPGHQFHGTVKVHALRNILSATLQDLESGMAFIDMQNRQCQAQSPVESGSAYHLHITER